MKITTDQTRLAFSLNSKQSSHKYDDKTMCLRRSDYHATKRKVRWNCDLKFVRSQTSTNCLSWHWKFYVSKWLALSLLFTTFCFHTSLFCDSVLCHSVFSMWSDSKVHRKCNENLLQLFFERDISEQNPTIA